jgi:hypothetical protein
MALFPYVETPVTPTELGYLAGVTGAIQTQFSNDQARLTRVENKLLINSGVHTSLSFSETDGGGYVEGQSIRYRIYPGYKSGNYYLLDNYYQATYTITGSELRNVNISGTALASVSKYFIERLVDSADKNFHIVGYTNVGSMSDDASTIGAWLGLTGVTYYTPIQKIFVTA